MDDAGAQHEHDLPDQERVIVKRGCFQEFEIVQAGRWMAIGVGEKFHQHDALQETIGVRHAHAGRG